MIPDWLRNEFERPSLGYQIIVDDDGDECWNNSQLDVTHKATYPLHESLELFNLEVGELVDANLAIAKGLREISRRKKAG